MQTFEVEIEGDSYKGMPFVLKAGERWIKNSGRDFYVDFAKEEKHVQKVPLPSWSSENHF